jgi:arylsulfatase A-like enzyme
VIARRTLLFAPLILPAESGANIVLIAGRGDATLTGPHLKAFAAQSVVFARAYACCPNPELAERALVTSRYPHAGREGDQPFLRPLIINGDAKLGEFLADLDKRNAARETIVCLTAFPSGEEEPLEKCVRVPLAIRYPRKLQPAVRDLASQVDIVPTLLALRGDEIPEGVQGIDLFGRAPREVVLAEGKIGTPEEWRMLVRGYDKIVATPKGEVTGLFNLADDPAEMNNQVRDPAQKLRLASMKAQLLAEQKKLGDGMDPSGLRRR